MTEKWLSLTPNPPRIPIQESYLKDTTDFLNVVEETKVAKDTMLVSMDVASLYTNIPLKQTSHTYTLPQRYA